MVIILSEVQSTLFSDYDDADDIDKIKLYDDDADDDNDDFLDNLQCQDEGERQLLLANYC